jgi:hypothetical protein
MGPKKLFFFEYPIELLVLGEFLRQIVMHNCFGPSLDQLEYDEIKIFEMNHCLYKTIYSS